MIITNLDRWNFEEQANSHEKEQLRRFPAAEQEERKRLSRRINGRVVIPTRPYFDGIVYNYDPFDYFQEYTSEFRGHLSEWPELWPLSILRLTGRLVWRCGGHDNWARDLLATAFFRLGNDRTQPFTEEDLAYAVTMPLRDVHRYVSRRDWSPPQRIDRELGERSLREEEAEKKAMKAAREREQAEREKERKAAEAKDAEEDTSNKTPTKLSSDKPSTPSNSSPKTSQGTRLPRTSSAVAEDNKRSERSEERKTAGATSDDDETPNDTPKKCLSLTDEASPLSSSPPKLEEDPASPPLSPASAALMEDLFEFDGWPLKLLGDTPPPTPRAPASSPTPGSGNPQPFESTSSLAMPHNADVADVDEGALNDTLTKPATDQASTSSSSPYETAQRTALAPTLLAPAAAPPLGSSAISESARSSDSDSTDATPHEKPVQKRKQASREKEDDDDDNDEEDESRSKRPKHEPSAAE